MQARARSVDRVVGIELAVPGGKDQRVIARPGHGHPQHPPDQHRMVARLVHGMVQAVKRRRAGQDRHALGGDDRGQFLKTAARPW